MYMYRNGLISFGEKIHLFTPAAVIIIACTTTESVMEKKKIHVLKVWEIFFCNSQSKSVCGRSKGNEANNSPAILIRVLEKVTNREITVGIRRTGRASVSCLL